MLVFICSLIRNKYGKTGPIIVGFKSDLAPVLLDDSSDYGQSQSTSASDALGGKEGIEDFRTCLGGYGATIAPYADQDLLVTAGLGSDE